MRNPSNERERLDAYAPALPQVAREQDTLDRLLSRAGEGERVGVSDASATNTRRCILTGERPDPALLVRLALSPDGEVLPDVRAKAPGRGAWIAVDRAALQTAVVKGKLKGALARAFKTGPIAVPEDLAARVEQALERAALDRLGLEARGGTLVTGGERIADAARGGKLHLLLHAADASTDGNRKLDQAWRVGRDAEGSGEGGLAIAANRTILSLALGRENVVHIGVSDRAAATRVLSALDRWQRFIGFLSSGQPCESASQGTTPARGANGGEPAFGRS